MSRKPFCTMHIECPGPPRCYGTEGEGEVVPPAARKALEEVEERLEKWTAMTLPEGIARDEAMARVRSVLFGESP